MRNEAFERSATTTQDDIPPGFTLLHTFRGHMSYIYQVAWSPDGKILASASGDEMVQLWDAQSGRKLQTLMGHQGSVYSVAWSPDGKMLASGSRDGMVQLWDAQSGRKLQTLTGHKSWIRSVAWSPDRKMLASGSDDRKMQLWDAQSGQELRTLMGHKNLVLSVTWSPDGKVLASGSSDQTVRLWDAQTGQSLRILEAHTDIVDSVSFSYNGLLLASKSLDGTVRIWDAKSGAEVASLSIPSGGVVLACLAFHPHAPVLATLGEYNIAIRIWELDVAALLKAAQATPSIHYTTAKIALVGDSGVGKSGLGYRIAEDRFEFTPSTHGQQFWVVDKLGQTRKDGTQCEAVLWDFAGQPNFRPIHALFLDEVDLALVLFDPSRPDTFTGVDYWLKHLSHKRELCRTVLVAARTDVSLLSQSSEELDAFCRERNISGGFVATSALTNIGVDALLKRIRQQIDWDAKPATVTTETFKRIKDYILALKADAQRKNVLMSPEQLRVQLQATDPNWQFSDAEMMTAVGHLQNHGYVTLLRRSSDEQRILLAPDLLINLAARYMLTAQSNEKGLGALEEARALRNEYRFPEVEGLSDDERDILLKAAIELFLDRNICFRESVDNQTFLIFPSLIFERPPRLVEDAELVEDTTYIITGQVENVYPALVVLLGYSPSFQRTNQWRKQAQYETTNRDICSFKLANEDPGQLELVLHYGKRTPDYFRLRFQGLFEQILYSRQVTVRKYEPVICPKCGRQQERHSIMQLMEEGEKFLFCAKDGKKIPLPKVSERLALNREDHATVVRDEIFTGMRTSYETALSSVKDFIRTRGDKAKPTCFVSYAWGNPAHERWVLRLTDDLRTADIDAVLDQLDNSALGASVPRFASRIEKSNFIIVVGTPFYREKYENKLSKYGSMVAAEVDLINIRLTGTEKQKATVLPVLLVGEERTSFPPLLQRRVYGNFTREEDYFVTLFDLLLTIYQIPFGDPVVRDLRVKLREEAQAFTSRH